MGGGAGLAEGDRQDLEAVAEAEVEEGVGTGAAGGVGEGVGMVAAGGGGEGIEEEVEGGVVGAGVLSSRGGDGF